VLLLRACFFCLFVGSNVLMTSWFARALDQSRSTIEPVVTNYFANVCFTALLSWLLFNEALSARWLLGMALMFTGVCLIQRGTRSAPKQ